MAHILIAARSLARLRGVNGAVEDLGVCGIERQPWLAGFDWVAVCLEPRRRR